MKKTLEMANALKKEDLERAKKELAETAIGNCPAEGFLLANQLEEDFQFIIPPHPDLNKQAENLLYALYKIAKNDPSLINKLPEIADKFLLLYDVLPSNMKRGQKGADIDQIITGIETILKRGNITNTAKYLIAIYIHYIISGLQKNDVPAVIQACTQLGRFIQENFPGEKFAEIQRIVDDGGTVHQYLNEYFGYASKKLPSFDMLEVLSNVINQQSNQKDRLILDALSKGISSFTNLMGKSDKTALSDQEKIASEIKKQQEAAEIIKDMEKECVKLEQYLFDIILQKAKVIKLASQLSDDTSQSNLRDLYIAIKSYLAIQRLHKALTSEYEFDPVTRLEMGMVQYKKIDSKDLIEFKKDSKVEQFFQTVHRNFPSARGENSDLKNNPTNQKDTDTQSIDFTNINKEYAAKIIAAMVNKCIELEKYLHGIITQKAIALTDQHSDDIYQTILRDLDVAMKSYQAIQRLREVLSQEDDPIKTLAMAYAQNTSPETDSVINSNSDLTVKEFFDHISVCFEELAVLSLQNSQKDGFFKRHWKKIATSTGISSVAGAGAAVGVAVGLLGMPFTFGTSLLISAGIGLGAGLAVGAFTGVGAGAVSDRMNRTREKTKEQKDGFFKRHWKKIATSTGISSVAGAGAAVGVAVGLLGMPFTFGTSLLISAGIGLGAGLAVGAFTGVGAGAVSDRMNQTKEKTKEPVEEKGNLIVEPSSPEASDDKMNKGKEPVKEKGKEPELKKSQVRASEQTQVLSVSKFSFFSNSASRQQSSNNPVIMPTEEKKDENEGSLPCRNS